MILGESGGGQNYASFFIWWAIPFHGIAYALLFTRFVRIANVILIAHGHEFQLQNNVYEIQMKFDAGRPIIN